MFDPSLGRWITEDPIGFAAGDENLYRFVENNPTNLTDPSGLQPVPRGEPGAGGFLGGTALKNNSPPSPNIAQDAAIVAHAGLSIFSTEGLFALASGIAMKGGATDVFVNSVANMFPNKDGYSQDLRTWIQEATRHYYWQMMLTTRYGPEYAKLIGDAHELGGATTLDKTIDLHHNKMARAAAQQYHDEFLKTVAQSKLTPPLDAFERRYIQPHLDSASASMVWGKVEEEYKKRIGADILMLVQDTVKNKSSGGKMILDPCDPYIMNELKVPLSMPPGNGRPGWPPRK